MSMSKPIVSAAGAVALAVTMLVGAAPPAQAASERDIHVPGTACRPIKESVPFINYNNTSAVNESTSIAQVICPLQYQSSSNGEVPVSMDIKVINRVTNGANISCFLSVFSDGNITSTPIFSTFAATNGGSTAVQNLHLSLPGNLPGNMFSVMCGIPATVSGLSGEIVSYRLRQNL